ncbi:hypothetical protein BOTBODRAFT_178297 [Botryobasidium botryosum FD-172 SS1]|uniref:Cell morphogenesis protein N-terminal domain-containing protein n=1 Tax=Botryobasidium botryosum (strain FD-172 SS1) TaxID=930990 RepID=A0A067MEG5_BOTB1|nr:hypothetical protein BOTBODRAFT_178297 [Botryobasidium botryosum FD-172 SS1]
MGSEGVQIEIPNFDDDEEDYGASTFGFGRPQPAFGAQGSPTLAGSLTPVTSRNGGDRPYFHSRGDSANSEGSGSIQFGSSPKLTGPIGHSSSSSVATTSFAPPQPARKSSFASLRAAFKQGKSTPQPTVPPLPTIEPQQSLPVLRNPFARSVSAQGHHAQTPSTGRPRRPSAAGASQSRITPPSVHSRGQSGAASTGKFRTGHAHGLSLHSRASSTAHSDHSEHGSPSVVPPVPKVPNGIVNHRPQPSADADVTGPPSTSAEYALRSVFTRFVMIAEMKITELLKESLEYEVSISSYLGPGVDPSFDSLMESLAHIAQKTPKPVLGSVVRWREGYPDEPIPEDITSKHAAEASQRPPRHLNVTEQLKNRRDLASIYVLCRALIIVISSLGKDSIGDLFGNNLEALVFEEFTTRPDLKLLAPSENQRTNAELYAVLLGHLSSIRFVTVTDRFLHELAPLAAAQVPRDHDLRFENIVRGLKHIKLRVWPPESFDESAEFLESLARCFANAHGLRLKSAFAEVLVHMIHPMGKTAQAEVNHPMWERAIELIYPKAKDMMSKPRYWNSAYPLAVTSLCLAPHDYFVRNWTACFEASLGKLKQDKATRTVALNGIIRLFWTYLYRCHEPSSTVLAKLDGLLKHFFPANRRVIFPSEDSLDAYIPITHFIFARHFEYGQDLLMDLMQESTIQSLGSSIVNVLDFLAPERTIIAIMAALQTFRAMERDAKPVWPSNLDFHTFVLDDYPTSADVLPPAFFEKLSAAAFFERYGPVLAKVTLICGQAVGYMSILDPRYKFDPSFGVEEREHLVIRNHADGAIAYPKSLYPLIEVLTACFDSWPRFLHSSVNLPEALELLIYAVSHVEPSLAEAASKCLRRFAAHPQYVEPVIERLNLLLFSPVSILRDTRTRLATEHIKLVELWVEVVGIWAQQFDSDANPEDALGSPEGIVGDSMSALIDEIEAGGLYLLTSISYQHRLLGGKVLREGPKLRQRSAISLSRLCLIDILSGKGPAVSTTRDGDNPLQETEGARLLKWRQANYPDLLLRLAESPESVDEQLWVFLFPPFIRTCVEHVPNAVNICRESLNAAILRVHPLVSTLALAGNNARASPAQVTRFPPGPPRQGTNLVLELTPDQQAIVEQWRFWAVALCACAVPPDTRPSPPRDHARVPSDSSTQRERLATAKGLFRHLIPFLASDHNIFREAAVTALGCTHQSVYRSLLDDMQSITRHIHDEFRNQPAQQQMNRRGRRQDRLHTAVVRVYSLTSHFILDPRTLADQGAISLILQFVRETQTFLSNSQIRDDWEFSRLRRYFCGVVGRLFEALSLSPRKDWDRFMPPLMRLTLFRICEDWCTFGASPATLKRIDAMREAAPEGFFDYENKRSAMEHFEKEIALLSPAAAAAMASLCAGAFFTTDTSPIEARPNVESLEVVPLLDWIAALLSSGVESVRASGRKALRSLLSHSVCDLDLINDITRRSLVSTNTRACSPQFFEVVAEDIIKREDSHFSFHQVAYLGLANLGHSDLSTRHKAFEILEALHSKSVPGSPLMSFEAAINSAVTSVYLRAQRQISATLATIHPGESNALLAQCALRLPQTGSGRESYTLRLFPPWIANLDLMDADRGLSTDGNRALRNLFGLSVRYADVCPDVIDELWTELVSSTFINNGTAVVKFLIEQATRQANPEFVTHARKVIGCLSCTAVGPKIFVELCSVIEPESMTPAQEIVPSTYDTGGQLFTENLEALLPPPPTPQPLYPGELALLYLGGIALERAWDFGDQLPSILHAMFTQLDHRMSWVHHAVQRMFFQVLRSWIGGYEDFADRDGFPTRSDLKATIGRLEAAGPALFWMQAGHNAQQDPVSKMENLCTEVITLLEPLHPGLRQHWGSVALRWGTTCAVRETAVRSFQIFRALKPDVESGALRQILERLSNVISDQSPAKQSFAKEILSTLAALPNSSMINMSLLPQLFWCATACLATTVEAEFALGVRIFDSVLDRLDCSDPDTQEYVVSQKPFDWRGTSLAIHHLVFSGLRSSVTSEISLKLLARLVKLENSSLTDATGSRLRQVFAACLPWCLAGMENKSVDDFLIGLALDIARLADLEGRSGISRIMTSFAKSRFRTKEDFFRQAVMSLRDFSGNQWTEVVSILLGLVFNSERWLRIKAMQILKLVFQNMDKKHTLNLHGTDLLDPLLRLLWTDLASDALEVLEEPLAIAGGPTRTSVLRMSVHGLNAPMPGGDDEKATESGWCIDKPVENSFTCRQNIEALANSCETEAKPGSRVTSMDLFDDEGRSGLREPEIVVDDSEPFSETASLGELVNTLDDLNSFFQADEPEPPFPRLPHSFNTEETGHRVAAILSRSLAQTPVREWEGQEDGPSTPFVGLFSVSNPASEVSADSIRHNFMVDSDGEDDIDSRDTSMELYHRSSPLPYDRPLGRLHNLPDSEEENLSSLEAPYRGLRRPNGRVGDAPQKGQNDRRRHNDRQGFI